MNWMIKHWYHVGATIGVLIVIDLLIKALPSNNVQFLLILNLLFLFAHQFEEYQLPGGAPVIINRVVYDETTLADHYPGNGLSIMVVNVVAWLIYLVAILLPNVTWLGLGVVLFSLFQILGHGLEMPIKLKAWYNPGLATSVLLFLPLGIVFIRTIASLHLLHWSTWLGAIGMLIGCIVISIVAPVQLLKDKQTNYPIDPWQVRCYQQVMDHCQIKKG